MKEYIDRKKVIDLIKSAWLNYWNISYIYDQLDLIPTVNAVPVVRCKDCKYSYDDISGLCCSHGVCVDCIVPSDFFCLCGERK